MTQAGTESFDSPFWSEYLSVALAGVRQRCCAGGCFGWLCCCSAPLRNWLFGLGDGIRIEAPTELRGEHQSWLRRSLDVYGSEGG